MNSKSFDLRQQLVYTLLAGIFLGTLGFVNLLGISHFVDFSFHIGSLEVPLMVPIGALPYPCTFLCINIICELFGRTRANYVIYAGLLVNLWIFFFIWIAGLLPSSLHSQEDHIFFSIRQMTLGAITASVTAYFISQLLDVYLFQYWRKLTKGGHLWLRSNFSTLISQFIDTAIVISLTFLFTGIEIHPLNTDHVLSFIIISSYLYKVFAAILGTVPFYFVVSLLKPFLFENKAELAVHTT